jgi:hypothetical protein
MTPANRAALTCFAAAAAWPVTMGWLANVLMSPLDRAMRQAWCGVPYHDASALLGHCAACWIGSAVLAAVGLSLLASRAHAAPRKN